MKNIFIIVNLFLTIFCSILKTETMEYSGLSNLNDCTFQLTHLSYSRSPYPMFLGSVTISSENYAKCNEQLIFFMNTLTLSPKVCDLLDKIKIRHGFIELAFLTGTDTGAHCYPGLKKVVIETGKINNKLKFCRSLIWELCNLSNKFVNISEELFFNLSGNHDNFAFFSEAAEHFTYLRTHEIIVDYLNVIQNNEQKIK